MLFRSLRIDIGVGSYIEFEVPRDLTASGANAYDDRSYFRGMVIKVEHNIDAQAPNASTTFTVGYVRSVSEEGTDLCMEDHPLYAKVGDYAQNLGIPMDIV